MKKTSLTIAIIGALTNLAHASSTTVDRVEADRQTNLLIAEQMTAIDATVLAQLEAQNSNVVVFDNTTYEKQENGVWKIVGGASAALLAGIVSSSSTTSEGKPAVTNPLEAVPEIDTGRSVDRIAENAWVVTTHGEVDGYVTFENGTIYVRDSDRQEVASWKPGSNLPIQGEPSNPIEATPEADNGRSVEKIAENAWVVTTHDEVDGYITIENGTIYVRDSDRQEIASWKPGSNLPIQGTPSNPIEATPEADNGRSVEKIAENAWVVTTHDEVDGYITIENGTIYVRDSNRQEIASWKPGSNLPIQGEPSNPIEATPEADNGRSVEKIAENAWVVTTHDEVDGYITIENGTIYVRDSDRQEIASWKPGSNLPIQGTPSNPIEATPEADNGRSVEKIAENAWVVTTHDEVDGYITIENGTIYVRDSNRQEIASWKPGSNLPIQGEPSNPIEATPEADNGRSVEKIAENAWVVTTHDEVDGYITIENGTIYVRDSDRQEVASWKPGSNLPIQGTPSNPIEATPEADNGRSVEKIAENAWVVTTHDEVDGYITIENGTIYVRDSDRQEIASWKPGSNLPIQGTPSNPIEATPEADNGRSVEKIAENAWVVTTHDEVDGYITIENGTIYVRDSDRQEIASWKPGSNLPIQGTPSNPIEATPEADNGRSVEKIAENAWVVTTHDEVEGYITIENGTIYVRNSDLQEVASWKPGSNLPIQGEPSNPIEATPEADNGRSVEKIAENAWVVTTHDEVDGYITIENGTIYVRDSDRQEIASWKPGSNLPIQGTPSNPIEATPEADNGRSVEKIAENAWVVTTHDEVDGYITIENGTIYVRDSDRKEIASWKPGSNLPIQGTPSNPIEATPEADNGRSVEKIADNAWAVSTHGTVDGYITIENGTLYVRDSDLNEIANWSPRKPEFDRNKLKQRMEKLTIKQRQQIRQSISSRL